MVLLEIFRCSEKKRSEIQEQFSLCFEEIEFFPDFELTA